MDLNIAGKLKQSLLEGNRKPDGLLHCSGLAHCEYSQIQQAVGEIKDEEPDLIDLTVMYTGTMWHREIQKILQPAYYDAYSERLIMVELDLTEWLPKGWSGSTDGVFIMDRQWAVPIDIKTMNGEGMRYIKGVKPEHRWQVSAYRLGIKNAIDEWRKLGFQPWDNIQLHDQCVIIYMPVSRAKDYIAEPVEVWFDPLPEAEVIAEMEKRATALQWYKDTGENIGEQMPMEVKAVRSTGGWQSVKVQNNWWVNYCPAKDCPCAKRTVKIIGKVDPGGTIYIDSKSPLTIHQVQKALTEGKL